MTLIQSWVTTANTADCPFPLNNLPYGVFSTNTLQARCGVAIGDMILDMRAAEAAGLVDVSDAVAFDAPSWNKFMALGRETWAALRARLITLLANGSDD